MNIAMMSTWNVPCGASVHSKLIGNSWIKAGHKLTIFAPYGVPIIEKQNESWIKRNYSLNKDDSFDAELFLDNDFDIFVLQQIPPMPIKRLLSIAPEIKKKAKTVVIIHEGNPPGRELRKFPWDAVVCFDKRYKKFLKEAFNDKKIRIINYPCHPVLHGDKIKTRKNLDLPKDKMILMVYGIAVHHYFHIIPTLQRVNKERPLMLVVFTGVRDWFDLFRTARTEYKFINPQMDVLTTEKLYKYLHASDALIYHRDSSIDVVVASTIFECLGSGCPILASDSNFVETLGNEIIKYGGLDKLEELLLSPDIKDKFKNTVEIATRYAEHNSADNIAEKYIKLFKSL